MRFLNFLNQFNGFSSLYHCNDNLILAHTRPIYEPTRSTTKLEMNEILS